MGHSESVWGIGRVCGTQRECVGHRESVWGTVRVCGT